MSNRCGADGAHRTASLALIAPPRADSRWQDENRPPRVANITAGNELERGTEHDRIPPLRMPPGISRRLNTTPMELVYESDPVYWYSI